MALEEVSLRGSALDQQNGKEKKGRKEGKSEGGGEPEGSGAHGAEIEALTASGHRALMGGRRRKALSLFRKALGLSLDTDGLAAQRTCAFNLGAAYVEAGKPGKGLPLLLEARPTGGPMGDLLFNIGAAHQGLGHFGQALEAFREAQGHYRCVRAQSEAGAGVKMGQCLEAMGEAPQAARCFLEAARALSAAGGPEEEVAAALREAIRLVLHGSEDGEVVAVLHEGRQLCEGIQNRALRGKLHHDIGLAFSRRRIFSLAAESFSEALSFLRTTEDGPGVRALEASSLQHLGAAHNALQRYDTALGLHRRAAALHSALGDRGAQGQCFANLAQALSGLGAHEEAGECHLHALQAFRDAGDLRGQCRSCEGLGATRLLLGDPQRAATAYREALVLLSRSQDTSEAVQERIVSQLAEALQAQLAMAPSSPVLPTDPQHRSPMTASLVRFAASLPSPLSSPQRNRKGFLTMAHNTRQGCHWTTQWPLQRRAAAQNGGLRPQPSGHRVSAPGPNQVPNGDAILATEGTPMTSRPLGRTPGNRSWRDGLRSAVCAVM